MLNANEVGFANTSKEKKPDAPALDAGTYPARLVKVVGVGLHAQDPYQGQEKKPAQFIRLTYQLDDEFMPNYDKDTNTYEEGTEDVTQPRWFDERIPFYNLAADQAKSTARYNTFDADHVHKGAWDKLLGEPVGVVLSKSEGTGKNSGRTFNNITGTTPMSAKAISRMTEMVNPQKQLAFDASSTDVQAFESLVFFVQDDIKAALDFAGTPLSKVIDGDVPKPTESGFEAEGNDEPW